MFKALSAVFVTVFLFTPSIGSATIVYDNLTGPTEVIHAGWIDSELADQVTLAGTERLLTGISIEYRGDFLDHGLDGDEFVSIQFYKNDGPAGAPGTMFYQSGLIPILSPTSTVGPQIFIDTITLPLPYILAPDTFTWSILRYGMMAVIPVGTDSVQLIAGGIPSIGASDDFIWYNSGSGWIQSDLGGVGGSGSALSNYHARISALAEANILFQAKIDYPAGDRAGSVAMGDLDGDGDLDLAVANWTSDDVSVLLGNGDGTFQNAVNYGAGAGDVDGNLAMGDLDGDGDLDLAVADDGVSVFLGNGDGTFQNAVNYYFGDTETTVAIGDLDGDGDLDLAVANGESDNVSVMLGNGDGTFQNAVDYIAGSEPDDVAIGDLDGDGDLDIAVPNDNSENVSVFLGNGNGTFQGAVNYGVGSAASSLVIGDLNGDGDLDLALANDDVLVLLGNGDGTFQNAVNYGAGEGPEGVAVGDLDGDGDLDLAVANGESDNVSVMLGNGDGTFQSAINFGVGEGPEGLAVGDLDGDGDLDLAVANSDSDDVSILINISTSVTIQVVAQFSGNPTSGVAPLTVMFTDQSTGNVTSWSWDFGDGSTSTVQNPSHTYNDSGTYTVSLTVTGPEGSDTKTKTDFIVARDASFSTAAAFAVLANMYFDSAMANAVNALDDPAYYPLAALYASSSYDYAEDAYEDATAALAAAQSYSFWGYYAPIYAESDINVRYEAVNSINLAAQYAAQGDLETAEYYLGYGTSLAATADFYNGPTIWCASMESSSQAAAQQSSVSSEVVPSANGSSTFSSAATNAVLANMNFATSVTYGVSALDDPSYIPLVQLYAQTAYDYAEAAYNDAAAALAAAGQDSTFWGVYAVQYAESDMTYKADALSAFDQAVQAYYDGDLATAEYYLGYGFLPAFSADLYNGTTIWCASMESEGANK